MNYLDWIILLAFFAYILWDGTKHAKTTKNAEELLLANRSMPWWAMGISIMATQASAISFIGTTGQAFTNDMQFVQMYLGLPIAIVILCITIVPFYHKLRAFTAYEALEQKFGIRVRLVTSFLFLLSRGLAMGAIVAAPSYVLSLILDLPLWLTVIIIGISATIYTTFGGITGVIRTDVKQMVVMMIGLIFIFFWIVIKLPDGIGAMESLKVSGALGKLQTLNFSFESGTKYNIWAGTIASMFLMLSYFGTDQSQVQRLLTAKSLKDSRVGLLMTAVFKIPMVFFMLLIGALLYSYYVFNPAPQNFAPQNGEFQEVELAEEHMQLHEKRKQLAYQYIEGTVAKSNLKSADQAVVNSQHLSLHKDGENRNDTNYVVPYFILTELPNGIIGLIIAAIFAAALSSIDSGLNSLAASSVMDWYKRFSKVEDRPTGFYLKASRLATLFWGVFATAVALLFGETNSIIELVNEIGSYFYGSILGVFILLFVKPINAKTVISGMTMGILTVFFFDSVYIDEAGQLTLHSPYLLQTMGITNHPDACRKALSFLWLNPIGALSVVFWSLIFTFGLKLFPASKAT